jgi:hypothetical protein
MSEMDHGTAHERIEDLLLDPGRLAGLQASRVPDDIALRQHLEGCPACRADLDGWAGLQAALADALPNDAVAAAEAVQPIEPPASLRARVIAAVRSEQAVEAPLAPIAMASAAPLRRIAQPRTAWLGLAAALVVLVVSAGLLVDQASRLAAARDEATGLAEAVTAVDRVLSDPQHKIVSLATPSGAAGGSISWTHHDLVVLSTALAAPKPGEVYRCWLDNDGQGWAIGRMEFAGDTSYWVGSLDEWASFEIGPTTAFRVSLEPPGADPKTRSGPIVLEAALGA